MKELNKLLTKIEFLQHYLSTNEPDPLLSEELAECMHDLHSKYGEMIKEQLFFVYDDLCADEPIEKQHGKAFHFMGSSIIQ